MKRLLLILTFTYQTICLFGQNPGKALAEAEDLFAGQKFGAAFSIYSELVKTDPLNANLNYKIGACYLQSRSLKSKAAYYLEKALEHSPSLTHNANPGITDAPILAYKLLGDAYCVNYKFDQAIAAYEKYKTLLTGKKINDPSLINGVNGKIETCKFGKELKELVALPVQLKPNKPGKPSDTLFKSWYSSLSPDKQTMTFTLKVPVNKIQKIEDAAYFEEQVVKVDSVKPKQSPVQKNAYTPTPDTIIYATTIGSSVDGQIVLTYKNERGDGNLYITRLRNDQWSQPVKISKSSNPAGWEPNECLSPDGNTLYFVSNRPGGYGGKDIYRCKKTESGEWGKAINLGPFINSPYDDEAPFLHPNGTLLFFSSNRTKPKEYFDNFVASITDSGIVGKPVTVGYPIDKSSDNAFYEVAADKKKVFIPKAANPKKLKQLQADSLLEIENNSDNYLITFVSQDKTPLTLLKGQVMDINGKTIPGIRITITNNKTSLIQGIYHTDARTGQYSLLLAPGSNNNIVYEAPGFLFLSENKVLDKGNEYFSKSGRLKLQPIAKNSKTVLNNIFFEERKGVPLPGSAAEINRIDSLLTANPKIAIELSNYIYSTTEKKFFKKLSKARANAIKEELVAKGVDEERIIVKGHRKSRPGKGQIVGSSNQLMELEITDIK